MTSRSGRVALLVGLLAVAVAGTAIALRGGRGSGEPIAPVVTYMTAPMDVGAPATLGGLFIEYEANADITIISVDANVSDNVEVIGERALFPVPVGYGGSVHAGKFPPESPGLQADYSPAIGSTFSAALVDRDDQPGVIEVVVGVRATSGELGGLNGVRIAYQVDGVDRSTYFPHALVLCLQPQACDVDEEQALRMLDLLPQS